MLRLIAFVLLTPFVLAQEKRVNPFRGKDMPFIPYAGQNTARLEYFKLCEKSWTLAGSDYEDFFAIAVGSEHDVDSLQALVRVLEVHPDPRNAELILRTLPGAKPLPLRLTRARFLKVLANCIYDQEAWHRALLIAGTDKKKVAIIDEAAVDIGFQNRAWWLAERIRLNQLDESHYKKALIIIGREGTVRDADEAILAIVKNQNARNPKFNPEDASAALSQGKKSRPMVPIPSGEHRSKLVLSDPESWKAKPDTPAYQDLAEQNDEIVRKVLKSLNDHTVKPNEFHLIPIILDPKRDAEIRKDAKAALPNTTALLAMSRKVAGNEKETVDRRNLAIFYLLESKPKKLLELIELQELLPKQDEKGQKMIALVLADSPEGADLLLASAQSGKVKVAIITDVAVIEKLKAAKVHDLDERLKNLPK